MKKEPIKFFKRNQSWEYNRKLELPKKIASGHTLGNEDDIDIYYLAFLTWGAIIVWLIMI